MNVLVRRLDDEETWRSSLSIEINSIEVFHVADDEPEDSNLGRSFSDCYKIKGLIERAYKAGKDGEELVIEETNEEE